MTHTIRHGIEGKLDLYLILESETIDSQEGMIHHRLNTLCRVANAFPSDVPEANFNFVDGYFYPRDDKDDRRWVKRSMLTMAWNHARDSNIEVRWIVVLKDYERIRENPVRLETFIDAIKHYALKRGKSYLAFGKVGNSYQLINTQ